MTETTFIKFNRLNPAETEKEIQVPWKNNLIVFDISKGFEVEDETHIRVFKTLVEYVQKRKPTYFTYILFCLFSVLLLLYMFL